MSRKKIALLGVSLGSLIGFGSTEYHGFIDPAQAGDKVGEVRSRLHFNPQSSAKDSSAGPIVELADSSGESGEAGEAGNEGAGPLAGLQPDARIAIGLMMIRAHLQAALALKQVEPEAMGSPHLHHPIAQIFPQFSADLTPETAQQLQANLEAPVEALGGPDPKNRSLALTGAALHGVTVLLENSRWWKKATAGEIHQAIRILITNAAAEYGEGVAGSEITNEEEYQDSIGLIAEAGRVFAVRRELLAARDPVAAESLRATLAELPGENFAIPDRAAVSPNTMLAALSKIELLAGRFH